MPAASAKQFIIATIPLLTNRAQQQDNLSSAARLAASTIVAALSPPLDGLTRSSPHPLPLLGMSRLTSVVHFRFLRPLKSSLFNLPAPLHISRKPDQSLMSNTNRARQAIRPSAFSGDRF